MLNKNFLNLSAESKVNSKFILFWIFLAFLVVAGLFIYDRYWGAESSMFLESQVKKPVQNAWGVKTGVASEENWGATGK